MKNWIWACLLLTGCRVVGPNYQPPQNCVPDTWTSDPCCGESAPCAWWEQLQDPFLNRYIEAAAYHNNDILTAEARIYQARAMRQVAASSLFPQLNLQSDVSRTYFSKNGPVFAIGSGQVSGTTGLPFQIQIPQVQNLFTSLIDASWEIDLFGKIRRSVEAADATIGSAIEERNGVLITVLAEAARNYIDLRSAQQRGVLIEENISLLEEELALVQKQREKGLVDRIAVESAKAELAELKASLPPICAEIYQYMYALSTLTGVLPETLVEELLPLYPLPQIPKEIGCGLRSDIIRRRPDVRQAERDLAAATANIGVAVASFFPSFSLSADLGLQSLMLSNFFQPRSITWSIGASSTLPIYQGGNLVGNLHLSKGEAMAAAYTYQQTVLNALEEAESALIAYTREVEAAYQLDYAVKKYAEISCLTTDQFEKGLASRIDVINSRRRLNDAKQQALERDTAVLLDLVALYKALGGV
ncbi:MAG: efflux transporter outer membrane subunit [Waddliaceae bacterium]